MGQSFLTHDEKSSASPSPDLLQFNGGTQPKFFGSLSSVKERSTSSSSRSAFESADSDGSLLIASPSSSPRSPILLPATPEDGAATVDDAPDPIYSSLVPSPISPGNVSRLREKFMDLDRFSQTDRNINVINKNNDNSRKRETISGHSFISRPATDTNAGRRSRGGTLPSSLCTTSPRSRSSLYTLSPSSYPDRHYTRSSRTSRTLPSTPASFSGGAGGAAHDKFDGTRSNLSNSFRQITLTSSCTVDDFTSENPLVRQRPRTRPYVPPPRSVIIRAGYLPVVQTVNLVPGQKNRIASSLDSRNERQIQDELVTTSKANRSQSECFTASSGAPVKDFSNIEEVKLSSSSSPLVIPPFPPHSVKEPIKHVVTNKGDHTEKVLMKDAEVNTSAEILVLPKGTKTSVVLKSALMDEVDGKGGKKKLRRKKKRGVHRIRRVFRRIVFGLVELF